MTLAVGLAREHPQGPQGPVGCGDSLLLLAAEPAQRQQVALFLSSHVCVPRLTPLQSLLELGLGIRYNPNSASEVGKTPSLLGTVLPYPLRCTV